MAKGSSGNNLDHPDAELKLPFSAISNSHVCFCDFIKILLHVNFVSC